MGLRNTSRLGLMGLRNIYMLELIGLRNVFAEVARELMGLRNTSSLNVLAFNHNLLCQGLERFLNPVMLTRPSTSVIYIQGWGRLLLSEITNRIALWACNVNTNEFQTLLKYTITNIEKISMLKFTKKLEKWQIVKSHHKLPKTGLKMKKH